MNYPVFHLKFGRRPVTGAALSVCLMLVAGLSAGCTDYWWRRGQAKSVAQLVEEAHRRLDAAQQIAAVPQPLAADAAAFEICVISGWQELEKGASAAQQALLLQCSGEVLNRLVPLFAPASRPAAGELAGQARMFAALHASQHTLERHAFGLFASRALSLLADELSLYRAGGAAGRGAQG